MLAVTGASTTIIQELRKLQPQEEVVPIGGDLARLETPLHWPPEATRFVLAAGMMFPLPILAQSQAEVLRSIVLNCLNVVRLSAMILDRCPQARVCIVGSESAVAGSYDETYAVAKAGVHAYVRWKAVGPGQQLVVVAPPIISDAGMTVRRSDYPGILERRRTVTSAQVAQVISRTLWDLPPMMRTNVVVGVGQSEVHPWPEG